MTIAHKLAGALKRKDEKPNIELAISIVANDDEESMAELAELLDGRTKKQRHDALKVLYEVGMRKPELLVGQLDNLIDELESEDNRTLWGTMIALSTLVDVAPKELMRALPHILDASDRSSVIAKDKAMLILASLAKRKVYRKRVTPLLLEHVSNARTNQFPTYAERAEEALAPGDHAKLADLIEQRSDLDQYPAKRKRMDKLLGRIAGN